jgi:hypothetical protein
MIKIINEKLVNVPYNTGLIIAGHSYGGSVVNRLAEHYSQTKTENKNIHRLRFISYGSIYISEPSKVKNVELKNIIILGDIATIIARINIPKFVREHNIMLDLTIKKYITELNDRKDIKSKRITFVSNKNCIPRLNIFKRWKIHNSYIKAGIVKKDWWNEPLSN